MKNQEFIANRFEEAQAVSKLSEGTVARLAREQTGASPAITIWPPEADLARARTLAAQKGLRYQTCLKILLHQSLNSGESKRTNR